MKTLGIITGVFVAALFAFGGMALSAGQRNQTGSIQIKSDEAGLAQMAKIPMNSAIDAALKQVPGKVLRAELESVEKPVAPEKNPPGDIPDSQVFVKYTSLRGGYELDVPEGWARRTRGGDVIFASKLDGLSVTITDEGKMPDAQSVRKNQVKQLEKTGRAVVIKSIKDIKFKSGPAVRVAYESNSEPNPVTNKQVRLENNIYVYYRNGKMAELRLWAPVGADNVDQWNRISHSFRWR
jgi:hypothetical protein